mgnify:CR=1 FL=1|tara:strand:+ start:1558 stop:2535 length:978 start_codon:yes stop_codon:yes gene_type:complete
MAVTSTIEYCTDTNLLEVYPGLVGYDTKRRIYGWTEISSNKYAADSTGVVNQLFMDGEHLGSAQANNSAVDGNYDWHYSSTWDRLYFFNSTNNPNDKIMEGGEDWTTIKQTMRRRASRMVESLLDSRLSREIMKDREGNYPEFIIRATALKTIILLMRANDPENPVVESFEEEFKEIIDGYRSGMITLPSSITMDSSKGIIREVAVDSSSDLFPVELKGHYNGSGYELLKIVIDTSEGGVIGTAKMTVLGKSSTSLKTETIINSETITGDFQSLGVGSLKVRWSGDNVVTALCVEADEYEVELHGSGLESTVSQQGSIRLSRRYG